MIVSSGVGVDNNTSELILARIRFFLRFEGLSLKGFANSMFLSLLSARPDDLRSSFCDF